jgi:hypothetical protein
MSERENSERIWREVAEENGWIMPTAPWWKRLPVIRRFRAAYHSYRAESWANAWGSCGVGVGGVNPYDRWVIYGIAAGKERPTFPAKGACDA